MYLYNFKGSPKGSFRDNQGIIEGSFEILGVSKSQLAIGEYYRFVAAIGAVTCCFSAV